MNFLFFFVHPSKYHLYKHTINQLLEDGHFVKVLITSKDVLENLVQNEKWNYTNIFPEGRKMKFLPAKLSAIINTFKTLYRLRKYIGKVKYDLFITDDLLTILGKLKRIPTILFQDDDLSAVPESVILLSTATHILAPDCTNFGIYNRYKIGFNGFKASAYLHPNNFSPNQAVLAKYNVANKRYFIIRLVSLKATHDTGKKGLNDIDVINIIKKLEKYGEVIINTERTINNNLEYYNKKINSNEILDLIAFADLFISDSQTMSMEAGYLGTPYIRFNDFIEKISYLDELEKKYCLGFGIPTKDREILFEKIDELLSLDNLKLEWQNRRQMMLNETIDLSKFMTWFYENYPKSYNTFCHDDFIQLKFR